MSDCGHWKRQLAHSMLNITGMKLSQHMVYSKVVHQVSFFCFGSCTWHTCCLEDMFPWLQTIAARDWHLLTLNSMKILINIRTASIMTRRNGHLKRKRTLEPLAYKQWFKVHMSHSRREEEDQICICKVSILMIFWKIPSITKCSNTFQQMNKIEKTWLWITMTRKAMTVLRVISSVLSWTLHSSKKTSSETCHWMLTS